MRLLLIPKKDLDLGIRLVSTTRGSGFPDSVSRWSLLHLSGVRHLTKVLSSASKQDIQRKGGRHERRFGEEVVRVGGGVLRGAQCRTDCPDTSLSGSEHGVARGLRGSRRPLSERNVFYNLVKVQGCRRGSESWAIFFARNCPSGRTRYAGGS